MTNIKSIAFTATLALALSVGTIAAFAAASEAKSGKGAWAHNMKTFEQIDTDKNGFITEAEFKAAFAGTPKAAKAHKMFNRIDKDKNGRIERAEFDAWMAKRAKHEHGRRNGKENDNENEKENGHDDK
jgi:Ca2+-binding EF-hand superfamily protein